MAIDLENQEILLFFSAVAVFFFVYYSYHPYVGLGMLGLLAIGFTYSALEKVLRNKEG